MINSAGINFGRANEEFIIESDGNGALTSARNAVTGMEYIGAGNYSEVITGTAATPFGDYTVVELIAGLQTGDISMVASIDGTAIGISDPIKGALYSAEGSTLIIMSGNSFISTPGNESLAGAFMAQWFNNEQHLFFYARGTTTNATQYMASLPTTLTIYHHPMS